MTARRLLERGVRFVQLFHEAWDQHKGLTKELRTNCADTDRASAALIADEQTHQKMAVSTQNAPRGLPSWIHSSPFRSRPA